MLTHEKPPIENPDEERTIIERHDLYAYAQYLQKRLGADSLWIDPGLEERISEVYRLCSKSGERTGIVSDFVAFFPGLAFNAQWLAKLVRNEASKENKYLGVPGRDLYKALEYGFRRAADPDKPPRAVVMPKKKSQKSDHPEDYIDRVLMYDEGSGLREPPAGKDTREPAGKLAFQKPCNLGCDRKILGSLFVLLAASKPIKIAYKVPVPTPITLPLTKNQKAVRYETRTRYVSPNPPSWDKFLYPGTMFHAGLLAGV